MSKILVTPRSISVAGHPALKKLADAGYEVVFPTPGKQPTEAELIQLLPGCAGYLAGVEEVNAKVLAAAKDLKVISRNGVGVDNIDMATAVKQGIVVHRAVGANARGVAELTMAHILSLARWIPFSDKAIKSGGWERRKGIELLGKILGVVGCGNIGRTVAKFALGMEMKVLAHDLAPDRSFAPSTDFHYCSLDEIYAKADIITLHCPMLPEGKPLIDRAAIVKMKRGVFLINTAREGLIDQGAVLEAINSGVIGGMAMDVFKSEPPKDDPLPACDRVIATPHIGGFTEESVDRAVYVAVENILAELMRSGNPNWRMSRGE
ncbi:MAG TPA: phosphoglycerate dehydrogenase [Planctomycetota bacterium]|jgi:phosphoglycerate dehydrogenase-like enzyme